jgi:hypothetical protein
MWRRLWCQSGRKLCIYNATPQALCYDRIGATLYFSALGVGSVSLLLPCVDLSWLVTFGAICKECRAPRILVIDEAHCPFGSSDDRPLGKGKLRPGTNWAHRDGRAETPSFLHKSLHTLPDLPSLKIENAYRLPFCEKTHHQPNW